LIRGHDPWPDAVQYGEELIPRVRELVADHDVANGVAGVKAVQTG
jgi:alkanesulfonate monooxygenase